MEPKYIIYITVSFLIIGVAFLGFYFGLKQFRKRKENNEYKFNGNEIEFVMYHVDWCPYCKQAHDPWDSVAEKYNNTTTKLGKTVKMHKIDCTNEEEGNQSKVNGEVIDSFPSIFFNNFKDEQVEFKSKCTKTTLTKFVENFISEN